MTSRWGPKVVKSEDSSIGNGQTLGAIAAAASITEEPVDDDHFEVIDEVEWGPRKGEDGYDTDQELAPRPRRKGTTENCGCLPPLTGFSCRDDSCVLYACREECRSNCESGHLCGNKRLTRKEFFDVEVFEAGSKGKGLRLSSTARPVVLGDIICEYTGRAIRKAALNRLFRRYQFCRRLYIMSLGDDVFLDARTKGGLARYINHSCRPNCKVELWTVKGVLRAAVVSLSIIQPGEELTFDYQWQRKRGRAPTRCYCGMSECRGTIEMSKSLEELDFERELDAHWEKFQGVADEMVLNRAIKVFSQESDEYFLGEVTGYDAEKKLHCVLYRQDMNEVWEDLQKENWMVLNERIANEHFIISKKRVNRRPSPTSSLVSGGTGNDNKKPSLARNYLYVQTPAKEAMWAMHLIERCQRNCNVQILADQMARPPLPPIPNDPEDTEKYASLDKSKDGTVWKLTITGSDVPKAYNILQKNVAFVEKKCATDKPQQTLSSGIGEPSAGSSHPESHEVIFPRIIADAVKRKLHSVRDKCRSINITFVASDSKSKQFSKLILEGSLVSDIEAAKEYLWLFFLPLCVDAKVPMSVNKIPRNLGFLGTQLSHDEFSLLLRSSNAGKKTDESESETKMHTIEANEDLNSSPFIRSFESTNQCTVWVQSPDDQGRIDSSNRIVNEAQINSPRKVFFGCKPSNVARLAAAIQGRASDLARGVSYFHLGADRVYMKLMMKTGGRFFDFIKEVTGATVTVDPMTGDHLRTDGRMTPAVNASLDQSVKQLSEGQRALMADEIVRLQVECYRDECIREESWVFGRDWELSDVDRAPGPQVHSISIGQLNRKTVCLCGMEISETVARLGMRNTTAGHAALILYRFVHSKHNFTIQIKAREAILACVYLASKAQKKTKWKKLESVLEAGYETFYPGSTFNRTSEETTVLAERVIAAEAEILEAVQYDIFWKDIGWIKLVATHTGKMSKTHVNDVFAFAFSGPVLSAGAELWLKYGVEHIFAVCSAFLGADLKSILPALSLIPLKVSQAAKLLVESAKYGRATKHSQCSHPLLETNKENLEKLLPEIEQTCIEIMTNNEGITGGSTSEGEHRYRILGRQSRQIYAIRGIPKNLVSKMIIPFIEKFSVESSCQLHFLGSQDHDTEDLILDGSWRAIAVANHLFRSRLDDVHSIPPIVNITTENHDRPKEQAKNFVGLISAQDVVTVDAWKGTSLAENDDILSESKIGGKCCVPGKISAKALRQAGLRWWIPPSRQRTPTGSITDMCALQSSTTGHLELLTHLAQSVAVDNTVFPILSSLAGKLANSYTESFIPVSIQRWPPSKVASKESVVSKSTKVESLQMGFSAAALQELQILKQLHSVIPSNLGHPNFIVPVGIAFHRENGELDKSDAVNDSTHGLGDLSPEDPIFSLFRSNEDNAKAEKRQKQVSEGAHIVFQPAPFNLQRFISRKLRETECSSMSPLILAAWFHDILSALLHCHTNHILLRAILPDQIVVDQSGVAKIGALYRCTLLPTAERHKSANPRKAAILAKKKMRKRKKENDDDDDDVKASPYVAPEILLGCPKHSKESDVWAVGCLFANLLLNKPLFVGKDRIALLLSQYKVIGTPSPDNYDEAIKFPNFKKPAKKYRRRVEKAMEHVLKDQAAEHQGAIALIARMLHLDPAQRCTASEALEHEFMTDYLEKCESNSFKELFAADWVELKRHMLQVAKNDRRFGNEKNESRKRSMLRAVSKSGIADGNDVDDLYDMDDLLQPLPSKKARSDFL